MIGPEGDFSNQEIKAAVNNSFTEITLGVNRLRTETAGIIACSKVATLREISKHNKTLFYLTLTMDAKNISQGIIDSVIKLGLLALGIFLLLELKVLLVYILVAAIISLIGRPIVLILKNKLKFSNLLAVSFSL